MRTLEVDDELEGDLKECMNVQSGAQKPAALPEADAKSSGDDSTMWILSGFVCPDLTR